MAIREVIWSLRAKDEASKAIKAVDSSVSGVSKNIQQMGSKMSDVGKSMSKLGGDLTKKLTLPLAAVGTKAIHSVANFDDGMSKVRALTTASKQEFDALRKKAIQLGNDTAFSAQDASEGMQVLASAGRDVNEILDMSGDMFSLMSAATIDSDTAARVLNKSMSQFNLTSKDSTRIVDAYAKGQAESAASVENLEYILGKAGGSLASMNMEMEQSVAAAGHLANAGMPVAQVGTGLSAMAREIKANAGEFKKKGINVYDEVTGKLKTMGEVMEEVNEKVKGFTSDQQRDEFLMDLFSGQGAAAAEYWLNYGVEKYNELSDAIYDAGGAAADMADEMEDNIGGAFRSLSSSIGTLMIGIGDVLKEPVKEIATFVQDIADRFNNASPATQKFVVTLLTVVAAIGPVLAIGGKLFAGLGSVVGMVGKVIGVVGTVVGVLGGPLTVAMVAVIAIGTLIYQNMDVIMDKIVHLGTRVSEIWNAIKESTALLGAAMGEAWDKIKQKVTGALNSMREAWQKTKEFFAKPIKGAINIASKGAKVVKGALTSDAEGSHYTGLSRVPYDGYRAVLHKDEEVLRRSDPRNRNYSGSKSGAMGQNINLTFNINGGDSNNKREIANEVRREVELVFKKLNMQYA